MSRAVLPMRHRRPPEGTPLGPWPASADVRDRAHCEVRAAEGAPARMFFTLYTSEAQRDQPGTAGPGSGHFLAVNDRGQCVVYWEDQAAAVTRRRRYPIARP